jgi:hypothetical protein
MGTYNFDTFIYVNADKHATWQKVSKLYVPIDTLRLAWAPSTPYPDLYRMVTESSSYNII